MVNVDIIRLLHAIRFHPCYDIRIYEISFEFYKNSHNHRGSEHLLKIEIVVSLWGEGYLKSRRTEGFSNSAWVRAI